MKRKRKKEGKNKTREGRKGGKEEEWIGTSGKVFLLGLACGPNSTRRVDANGWVGSRGWREKDVS